MKIYYANMFGAKGLEKYLDFSINTLAAFPSFKGKEKIIKPPFCSNLFLDSGAFGKHRNTLSLHDYIEFIKKHKSTIEIYANLDVIGDPNKSYDNQKTMEACGLSPLPVFHYGSPLKWLFRLMKQYDYIALGGLVPISGNYQLINSYLHHIWGVIQKEAPDIKVHGFGVNNLKIMQEYPWYSVDASSVHVLARYGGVYTPFGTLKINPKVNSKEMEWQIKRPTELKKIKDFVTAYASPYTFEDCQEQSPQGTLLRCMVSIRFMEDFVLSIPSKKLKTSTIIKLL